MHRQQLWIAVALILVEASVFGYLSDTWTVPICVTATSLLALAIEWRFPLNPYRRFVAALALAIPFTIQWAFTPYEPAHLRTFILYSLAHAGGQYGLSLQTAYLWIKRPEETWSAAFPVCGVFVLMAAGDVQTTHFQNIIFQVFVLAFILLMAAYYSWDRIPLASRQRQRSRGRLILSSVALAITGIASVTGSALLERSWSTIERIYTEWMLNSGQEGAAGFSRQARLGSISDRPGALDQVPVLRIYSKEEPGYLRGAAFNRYRGGNWLSDAPRNDFTPDADAPQQLATRSEYPLFRLPLMTESDPAGPDGKNATKWQAIDVWPTGTVSDAAFVPLTARWLGIPQRRLALDSHGIVYPENLEPQANYSAYLPVLQSEPPPPLETGASSGQAQIAIDNVDSTQAGTLNLQELVAVPNDLDPRIQDLARTIFADSDTPEQKVVAVTGWFRKNYHYELGMKVPKGQDPLTYFLIRRPPSHCEYFASGTAILLRLGGVPCRYVTGFVSTEYNYLGGYWLVRNKDAHAWVEAQLPGQGWVTVESTPSAGVPHSRHSIQPRHLWDDLVLRVQMLRAQLLSGTWHGVWRAILIVGSMVFTTPHGWLILCGCVIWAIVLLRRHFRFTFRRRLDPVSTEFQRLLRELDRQLDRIPIRRQASETLNQFATRLADATDPALLSAADPALLSAADPALLSAADWYRAYAALRYRPESTPEEFTRLRAELRPIIVALGDLQRRM